jgi:hypothetical protein
MSAAHIETDRIAELSHGAAWTTEETAHLGECADCRLEVEVVAAARRLGTAQLAGFDARRVAAGVQSRLAARPDQAPVRGWHPGRWLAGLAAAAALVLAVRLGLPAGQGGASSAGGGSTPVVSILHELDGLSAPQLEEVLQSIPPATDALDHVEMAPLADLTASDLERMLRSMEEQ